MIFLGQILLIDGILSRVWVRPPLCLLLARVPSRKIQNQIFNFEIYLIFWIWSKQPHPYLRQETNYKSVRIYRADVDINFPRFC